LQPDPQTPATARAGEGAGRAGGRAQREDRQCEGEYPEAHPDDWGLHALRQPLQARLVAPHKFGERVYLPPERTHPLQHDHESHCARYRDGGVEALARPADHHPAYPAKPNQPTRVRAGGSLVNLFAPSINRILSILLVDQSARLGEGKGTGRAPRGRWAAWWAATDLESRSAALIEREGTAGRPSLGPRRRRRKKKESPEARQRGYRPRYRTIDSWLSVAAKRNGTSRLSGRVRWRWDD
jgi:hypothetical protein